MKRLLVLFFLFQSFIGLSQVPGQPNFNFGVFSDGRWADNFSGIFQNEGLAIHVQDDGKILVGGWADTGSDYAAFIARLTTSGSLDPTFNGTGYYLNNISVGNGAHDMILSIKSAGQYIYAAGTANNRAFIWRLTQGGVTDATFNGGIVFLDQGGSSPYAFNDIEVSQTGNEVLAAGNSGDDFLVARYTGAGVLDPTFDNDGVKFINFGGSEIAYGVELDNANKIWVAGSSFGTVNGISVVRLLQNGSIDNINQVLSFATITGGATFSSMSGFEIGQDNKLVFSGSCIDNSEPKVFVFKLLDDLSPDPIFHSTGFKIHDIYNATDNNFDLAIQKDLDIVLSGVSDSATDNRGYLMRLHRIGGEKDISFSSDGVVYSPLNLNAQDTYTDIDLDESNVDNKLIYVTGKSCQSGNNNCSVIVHSYFLGKCTVGINENKEQNLNVFPNPVINDKVNIRANEIIKEARILSLSGQVLRVMQINSTTATLTLDGLTNGVYILEVRTNKSDILRRKLIK